MEVITLKKEDSKKSVTFRLKPELDAEVERIRLEKEEISGLELTKTQIIEMLIFKGLEKLKDDKGKI